MSESISVQRDHPACLLTMDLIRCPSIAPEDAGAQVLLRERLSARGFEVSAVDVDGVTSSWACYGDRGPLMVFAVHADVVPAGDPEDWTSPPFEPEIRDGMLYGRGAADMKGPLAASVVAAERFLDSHGDGLPFRLGLIITGDEEPVNNHGTQDVLRFLEARKEHIDYCVVTEPTSVSQFGDTIKVGRRGSVNGFLTIHGKQGHSAYPELASNPVHRSLVALQRLTEYEWDPGDAHFPAASFQITNLHAGTGAANVIPGKFVVQFNVRHGTGLNLEKVESIITEIMHEEGLNFDLKCVSDAFPFKTEQGLLTDISRRVIREHAGLEPVLSTGGGTSDARFIAPCCGELVEFGLVGDTCHQVDERVSVKELIQLTDVYQSILEALSLAVKGQ